MNENFLNDLHYLMVEKLTEIDDTSDELNMGKVMGIYEAMGLIQSQLEAFGIKNNNWEKESLELFLNSDYRLSRKDNI